MTPRTRSRSESAMRNPIALETVKSAMPKVLLKGIRYLKCYGALSFGGRPGTLEEAIDFCVDRPILMAQVRSEIVELGKILQASPPRQSMEIGTNYGGTLLMLCTLSQPGARIISVDLPWGRFGGGYPLRKIPLFRSFPRSGQRLHLVRADSHAAETKQRVMRILAGEPLDYLFLDGDHTYDGVRRDFEMYAPLVRSGGIVVFHDIVVHQPETQCQVKKFWNEIKPQYRHREIIEGRNLAAPPIALTGESMETSGLGVLFIP
jgi:predicted O-methyltransferase YrrM